MIDIVDRLRAPIGDVVADQHVLTAAITAADEIVRLRGLVRWASHHVPPGTEVEAALEAEVQKWSS